MNNNKLLVLNIELKDDKESIKQYVDYHSDVWPEVIKDLKDGSIASMRIYIIDNKLTMLLEVPKEFRLEDGIHTEPPSKVVGEWSRIMANLAKNVGGKPDTWKETKLIFDTEDY